MTQPRMTREEIRAWIDREHHTGDGEMFPACSCGESAPCWVREILAGLVDEVDALTAAVTRAREYAATLRAGAAGRPVPAGRAADGIDHALAGTPLPPSPHICVTPGCGEPDAAHAIKDGARGACSASKGPNGKPCPCRQFTPPTQEVTHA